MKIQIGIQHVTREVELDVDLDAQAVQDAVAEALASHKPLTLTDTEGKSVIVPSEVLAYVTTSKAESRRVGFGFAN